MMRGRCCTQRLMRVAYEFEIFFKGFTSNEERLPLLTFTRFADCGTRLWDLLDIDECSRGI